MKTDELNKMKEMILPKTINLHNMICKSVASEALPIQHRGIDDSLVTVCENNEYIFELLCPYTGTEITIRFIKHN